MGDADTDATPATGDAPPATTSPAGGTATTQDEPLGDGGIRALEAERQARKDLERRLKELEPLAARARELEDAQKSELEKLTESLQTVKRDLEGATLDRLRLDVALDSAPAGMDMGTVRTLADRLRGSTREELEADAKALFDLVPAAATAPPAGSGVGRGPVESLRPGALPTTPEPSLADQIRSAEAAGDLALAGRLKAAQLAELRQKST